MFLNPRLFTAGTADRLAKDKVDEDALLKAVLALKLDNTKINIKLSKTVRCFLHLVLLGEG